jgi:DNA-binding CsgD family transcriptional regulator
MTQSEVDSPPRGRFATKETAASRISLEIPRQVTRKEVECLRWCKEGKTNWEIGEILFVSEKTVEFHLHNAMKKLGATNRMTAVVAAVKGGLISL